MLFLSPSVLSGKEAECDVSDFESVSKRALGEGAFGQVYESSPHHYRQSLRNKDDKQVQNNSIEPNKPATTRNSYNV